jgi:hypothetical protein
MTLFPSPGLFAAFVAAARANPRARWFDYGFAGLMSAFAARLGLGAAR